MVSKKDEKIERLIEGFRGRELPANYLAYFHLFNAQQYYEAHDVLEALWLPCRKGPDDHFYKGLIQLAGAFVHLQKDRLKPSVALFGLAEKNLSEYPAQHHSVSTPALLQLISQWRDFIINNDYLRNPLKSGAMAGPVVTLKS